MADELYLKKSIVIDGQQYNIQAVNADHSNNANYVNNKLTLTKSLTTGKDSTQKFDGSTAQEITYVPAGGGKFTGAVQIDNKHGNSVGGVLDSEIINYGQMKTKISQLTGATLYNWTTDGDLVELEKNTSEYYKLNTIVGRTVDLPDLESYSEGRQNVPYKQDDSGLKHPVKYDSSHVALHNGQSGPDVTPNIVIQGTHGGNTNYVQIKAEGFKDKTDLQTVYINHGATSIGDRAFQGCTGITSITIPDSVTSIGISAFEGCHSLTEIDLSRGITEIKEATFKNCSELTKITIGYNVTKIHSTAFDACNEITDIYFTGTEAAWNNITNEAGKANPLKALAELLDATVHFGDLPFPFLYICNDGDADTSLTSNKMYLKMPGESLIEISKGAVRLERPSMNPNSDSYYKYYTYDTLAAVIAGINSRLTALGSTALALPEELSISNTVHVAVPEISDDITSAVEDKTIIVEETVVPSVLDLEEELTYDNPDPVLKAVGGIAVGTSLIKGYAEDGETPIYYSVKEILTKMLYPYTGPAISNFTITTNSGIFEKGTEVNITGASVSVTKKTNDIQSVELYKKVGTVEAKLNYTSSGFSNSGGTVTFTAATGTTIDTIDGSTNTSYFVRVNDGSSSNTDSTSKTFTFVYPSYIGTLAEDAVINETNVESLEKNLLTACGTSGTFTYTKGSIVYAYPSSYGALTSIKDPNGFELLNSFTRYDEFTITGLDGTSQSYYVYVSSSGTNSEFKVTFIK